MELRLENISKSYNKKVVLSNFSETIEDGKCNCLMAPSGAGKTTLLRILMGLEAPESGSIYVADHKIGENDAAKELLFQAKDVHYGVVFQEDRLCEEFSAMENVLLVSNSYRSEVERNGQVLDAKLKKEHPKQRAMALLEKLDIPSNDKKPVATYSGGMKRRVAIARALFTDADLYLFDEPFTGMDEKTKQQVMEVVKEQLQGKTWVLVTHDATEKEYFDGKEISLIFGT